MDRTHRPATSFTSRYCGGSPFRRRRITWLILITLAVTFYYGAPWELPGYLKDVDGLTRANIAKLVELGAGSTKTQVNEIYGLLHMVTGPEHRQLQAADVNSGKPIQLAVYAGGDEQLNWKEEAKRLDKEYPVVVFSKTNCPYSEKVKALLKSYDLDPPAKEIEVDLRDDSDLIKLLLTRLTGRSTFPNVLVRGTSIGGWDETEERDRKGTLRETLI